MYIVLAKKGAFRTFLELATKEYATEVCNNFRKDGFVVKIVAGEYL